MVIENKNTIYITGSSGFVGKNLIKYFENIYFAEIDIFEWCMKIWTLKCATQQLLNNNPIADNKKE